MSAVLTLGDQHLPVQTGSRTVLTVTVHNDGPSMADLEIRVEGAAGRLATVEPPQLTLFPGAVSTVTVGFSVPNDGTVAAGPLPFTVWAVPAGGDGAPAAAADGTLDVSVPMLEAVPAPIVAADAVPTPPMPQQWTPIEEITPEVAGSDGEADPSTDPYEQTTEEAEGEEQAESPDTAAVPDVGAEPVAGEPAYQDFEPAPPLPPPPPFSPGPHPPPGIEVVRKRRALPTNGLAGAAAALGVIALAVLVIATLLWLTVGRDRVRSIAREEAGAAAGRPGGGVPGTERPIAGRLFLTGPGEVAFTVPQDRYLQVTDIVLQNPAGNTGTLRVRRDEAILLDVALENFRDLDYHFVTPIELGPSNRLVLEAACTSPPTAEGSGCNPSALFSGIFSEA